MRADRAVQFMSRRWQQAPAWDPGNHLRPPSQTTTSLSGGGTCSRAGVATEGA